MERGGGGGGGGAEGSRRRLERCSRLYDSVRDLFDARCVVRLCGDKTDARNHDVMCKVFGVPNVDFSRFSESTSITGHKTQCNSHSKKSNIVTLQELYRE